MPRFEGNDDGYLGWLGDDSDGYVLNVLRSHARHGIMPHRADCFTIQSASFRGRGWTRAGGLIIGARTIAIRPGPRGDRGPGPTMAPTYDFPQGNPRLWTNPLIVCGCRLATPFWPEGDVLHA